MVEEIVAELQPVEEAIVQHQTILIVDDDEDQVQALVHRLKKLGFRTLSAGNGQDAIDIALRDRPDLILLDLRLPDIEGFEVCARLVDSQETCGTPVIILSAMERPDIVRRSRAVGCEYYLRKPYDPNVLLTLIHDALSKSSEFDLD